MKTAVYPGSFNPFHKGHADIVIQALKVFDKVIIASGTNIDKDGDYTCSISDTLRSFDKGLWDKIKVTSFSGLLADFIESIKPDAVIKGLRNAQDFAYEKDQLYWNEDLGIDIPTMFIISDRSNCHISSSAIRAVNKIKSGGLDEV
jgi:pantetheine-phosphate adenylyltransferase